MLLKNSFLLSQLFYIVEFDFSWFQNTEQSPELLTLKTDAAWVSKQDEYWNYWVMINAF